MPWAFLGLRESHVVAVRSWASTAKPFVRHQHVEMSIVFSERRKLCCSSLAKLCFVFCFFFSTDFVTYPEIAFELLYLKAYLTYK